MTSAESLFSFVFDRRAAGRVLTPLPVRDLVMALLVRRAPEASWEGTEVYTGDSPLDPQTTCCLATRGQAAEAVQLRLLETMEELGIPVLEVYEGGPAPTELLAVVRDGRWHEHDAVTV